MGPNAKNHKVLPNLQNELKCKIPRAGNLWCLSRANGVYHGRVAHDGAFATL